MRRSIAALFFGLLFAVAGAGYATAQSTFTLTGVGSNIVLDGIYISPYTATINGVQTAVICDDFKDEVYVGESWMANSGSVVSPPTNGLLIADQGYGAVAWLSE